MLLNQWCTQNYEFAIAGRGDNLLSQIACLYKFIYPFCVSVIRVFYKYTLSHYIL